MGVCIETIYLPACAPYSQVTPYMGVCIETFAPSFFASLVKVTPYMGVCIETIFFFGRNIIGMSHPIWVCVLKLPNRLRPFSPICHTLYGCVY